MIHAENERSTACTLRGDAYALTLSLTTCRQTLGYPAHAPPSPALGISHELRLRQYEARINSRKPGGTQVENGCGEGKGLYPHL